MAPPRVDPSASDVIEACFIKAVTVLSDIPDTSDVLERCLVEVLRTLYLVCTIDPTRDNIHEFFVALEGLVRYKMTGQL